MFRTVNLLGISKEQESQRLRLTVDFPPTFQICLESK